MNELFIDPQVRAILDQIATLSANAPPLPQRPLAAIREGDAKFALLCRGGAAVEAVARTEDVSIPGPASDLPIRLYWPQAPALGTLMYFHGGGFLMGDLDSHDDLCRALANAAEAVVVGVHYRRAPETKFPGAALDCYAATQWVANNAAALGLPGPLAVGGDSAGGNLAAGVAQRARAQGGPALCLQLLIYPETSASLDWPSVKTYWEPGLMAAGKGMGWFRSQYFETPDQMLEPYAYPDNAADLSGLPAAMVITAEHDPMRDMGEAYARRLLEAGVPVTLSRYDGVTHVFASMLGRVDAARRAIGEAGEALRQAFTAGGR